MVLLIYLKRVYILMKACYTPKGNKPQVYSTKIEKGSLETLMNLQNCKVVSTKEGIQCPWFMIDLGEQRLAKLSGYFLQCDAYGSYGYPVKWKIEASLDNKEWLAMDSVTEVKSGIL